MANWHPFYGSEKIPHYPFNMASSKRFAAMTLYVCVCVCVNSCFHWRRKNNLYKNDWVYGNCSLEEQLFGKHSLPLYVKAIDNSSFA